MGLPIFPQGARGTPAPFHPEAKAKSKKQALTLGEQRGAHGDENDEQRVSKHGAHLARPSPRSHPARGKRSRASRRDLGDAWRDRPPRNTTTLTARRLHFRFRDTDPELQVFPLAGRPLVLEESGPRVSEADGARAQTRSRER